MYPSSPDPLHPSAYDFIVNPEQPGKPPLIKSNSMMMRLAIVVGGLLLLLIAFTVVKNLLTADRSNFPALVTVTQEQQELLHVTAGARLASLNDATKNAVITTQLSVASDQSELLSYITSQRHKIDKKTINLKVSPTIDKQLAASVAASTYDSTLKQVLESQLTSYRQYLKQAYAKTTGAKGKALLADQYKGAGLLLTQVANTQD